MAADALRQSVCLRGDTGRDGNSAQYRTPQMVGDQFAHFTGAHKKRRAVFQIAMNVAGQPFRGGGDPVLSLQLLEDRVLTSHGGKSWTARIWDLRGGQCEEEQSEEEEDDEDEGGRRRAVSLG